MDTGTIGLTFGLSIVIAAFAFRWHARAPRTAEDRVGLLGMLSFALAWLCLISALTTGVFLLGLLFRH